MAPKLVVGCTGVSRRVGLDGLDLSCARDTESDFGLHNFALLWVPAWARLSLPIVTMPVYLAKWCQSMPRMYPGILGHSRLCRQDPTARLGCSNDEAERWSIGCFRL
jgi:hypothetical protein